MGKYSEKWFEEFLSILRGGPLPPGWDPDTSCSWMLSLAEMSAPAPDRLLAILSDPSEDLRTRGFVARAVAYGEHPGAFDALCQLLRNDNPYLRACAAYNLGNLRDVRAIPILGNVAATDLAVADERGITVATFAQDAIPEILKCPGMPKPPF